MRERAALFCAQFLTLGWCLGTASAQIVIQGVVMGYDGKPMSTAQAQLVNAANERIDSTTPHADGAFELRSPRAGLFRLQLAGPLHGQKEVLIFADRPQTISIRTQLTAPEYSSDSSNLRLSTSNAKSPLNNTALVRQPDGTFTAEIESEMPELLLAVNGLLKNAPPLALPGAAEYRCLDNLHCYAVAHPSGGRLRVVFDPSLLVRTAESSRARYGDPDLPAAVAGSILDRAEEFNTAKRVARQETALKSGKATNQVVIEPPPAERVNAVIREIDRDRVPLVREARLFEYLLLVFLGAPADGTLVRRALDGLTPASPLWALNFGNVAGAAFLATGEPEKYIDYAIGIVNAQPTRALNATAAAGIIGAYGSSGRTAMATSLIDKARAELGDLPIVKMVLAQYGAERRIQTGKAVPAFHAPSLDDPALVYTEASLKGKVYLIDFWATWCTPCITEFPGLTWLYEKYRKEGFEILSYSIDSKAERVRQFRKERFPMTWLHAIDPELREIQSPMARDFEVVSIPRPVLVDASGTIIATDLECRGTKLEELLKRVLPAQVRP